MTSKTVFVFAAVVLLVIGFVLGVIGLHGTQTAPATTDSQDVGGVTHDELVSVGNFYQGIKKVLMASNGKLVGPISTSQPALFTSSTTVRGGLTQGGVFTIATTSSTQTLTAANMRGVHVFSISAMATSAALTLTLPATSTMLGIMPNSGDSIEYIVDNLQTAAGTTTTIVAGTGWDLDGITANDDILNGGVSGRLECWRLPNTDMRCIVEEMVDAG